MFPALSRPQGKIDPSLFMWACLTAFPGCLFALKYGPRAGVAPGVALIAYALGFAAHFAVAWWLASRLRRMESHRSRFLLVGGVLAYGALLLAVYLRIDPGTLNVDRWSALDRFWEAFSRGEYPYRSLTHLGSYISGFPGLFLAALPFWLLGDVGLMQFAALAGFAVLAWRVLGGAPAAFVLLLLAGLPLFVYEVMVRSDLFSNMVMAAWLLHLGSRPGFFRGRRILVAAFAWGLLLSTRGVVIIPLVLAAFPLLRGRGPRDVLACAAVVGATVAITLVPFYLWDPVFFREVNPYFVQSGTIPGWALAVLLVVTAWLGHRHRAAPRLYAHAGALLFTAVMAAWLIKSMRVGWQSALVDSGFDISYFVLPLPFLLLHLGARAFSARRPLSAEGG